MAFGLILLVAIGVVGMIALFAVGFLMNKGEKRQGDDQ